MSKWTAQELAESWSVERAAADGLIRFLVAKGLAHFRGERPNRLGRGKGAHVYEIDHQAGKEVGQLIKSVET